MSTEWRDAVQVSDIELPAFLASALVNGDTSGLDCDDIISLANIERALGSWYVVATDGDSFVGRCFGRLCEVQKYIIHRQRND